jgi:hypothetical protein
VGSRPDVRDDDIGPIMNPDKINSATQGLVNEYGIPTFDVHSNLKDTGAGLMEFCLSASDAGL